MSRFLAPVKPFVRDMMTAMTGAAVHCLGWSLKERKSRIEDGVVCPREKETLEMA